MEQTQNQQVGGEIDIYKIQKSLTKRYIRCKWRSQAWEVYNEASAMNNIRAPKARSKKGEK